MPDLSVAVDHHDKQKVTERFDPFIRGVCLQVFTGRMARKETDMWILWTILIGFVAGVLAKLITPGDKHEPQGFILTTLLGIVGAFIMTYIGQAVGWYQEGQSTGFIGATLGAILILLVWGVIASRRQTP